MDIIKWKEKVKRPIRILQFGEGRFLRAFIEDFVDNANEQRNYNGMISVIKPRIGGDVDSFQKQDCLYTLVTRGIRAGNCVHEKRVITAIDQVIHCEKEPNAFLSLARVATMEVVVSNTTENGICFSAEDEFEDIARQSFPGKLTRFLYERFCSFDGSSESGLLILPLELNENNGALLKETVMAYVEHWNLSDKFAEWIDASCLFCNTLVDRIVSGYADVDLPYDDVLIDVCEPYKQFVIETDRMEEVSARIPFLTKDPAVIITKDLRTYRERKVKILNGIHTAVALAGHTAGLEYVSQLTEDELFLTWIRRMIHKEIIPTITMEEEEVIAYADTILERFANPFLQHRLLDISMNSISKWKVRILPTIEQYLNLYEEAPACLLFSLAALLHFYHSGLADEQYIVVDQKDVLEIFQKWDGTDLAAILCNEALWGEKCAFMKTLLNATEKNMKMIRELGMRGAIRKLCG